MRGSAVHSEKGISSVLCCFSSRRRHTRYWHDWSSDVCSSDLYVNEPPDYVGGFERADIEGLLETMDRNYIGWANHLAPAIMKSPERPELGAELPESFRSEERRVGKECRSRWSPYH